MGYTDFDRECQPEWNIRMYSDIAYMLIKRCKKLKPDVFEKDDLVVLDAGCGFCVIIMTRADSNDEYRIFASLQKNKIEKVG